MQVKVKKLSANAVIPIYQTEGASGFDLHAAEEALLMPGKTIVIKTDLAFTIPIGYEMQVRPRSGMSLKTKLRISNSPGTIDSDYIGNIGIIIDNIGEESISIKLGDRIAQGVICPVFRVSFEQVNELEETNRGSGSFGSTGK